MITLAEIQRVNRERANRWHGGDFKSWSGLEWAGAMCGEAGEAANVAKKLKRVEDELDGNAHSDRPLVPEELREKLAGECADVLLYLSLLASRYDIDLDEAVIAKFNQKSVEMHFPERLGLVGEIVCPDCGDELRVSCSTCGFSTLLTNL